MQDRIRVKKIMKAVVQKANQVKDALNVDELIRQAKAHAKRIEKNLRDREKNQR